MRAGAHLVLLSAALIACTRPYCRFVIRGRRTSLVLEHIRPNGTSAAHILPMPSLNGEPDLAALVQQLNDGLGRDPLTGRHGLVPLQPQATTPAADPQPSQLDAESARRSGPVEYAQFVAEMHANEANGEPELHLWLPLVLRVWPNGATDAFMPQPEASDEEYWRDF